MEKWEEYYTKDQLNFLQKIESENLQTFITICKQLNLQYFLYGGTLLGAVKYGGIIPWDDDIDVAMPRKDYLKFIEYAPMILPKEYVLQNPYDFKESPYPYTKLRRRGTKFIEYINRNIKMETGIYIDIYPVDKIPDDEKLRKKQYKNVRRWILIYVLRQSKLYQKQEIKLTGKIKNIIKFLLSMLVHVFPQKYCISKIDGYMAQFNNSTAQRYAALNSPNIDNIYLKLYPLVEMRFGEQMVMAPGDYETHLRMRYGDYNKLPPKEKRYGHIPYALDFGEIGMNNI